MSKTTYISHADTNKLIRETLKIEFPGVKFSVRKHSGSTNIDWTDGPFIHEVETVVSFYRGASFDGMQDLKTYKSHTNEAGERIHYGADYIFCYRDTSRELIDAVTNDVIEYWNWTELLPERGLEGKYNRDYDNFPNLLNTLPAMTIGEAINTAAFNAKLEDGKVIYAENTRYDIGGWIGSLGQHITSRRSGAFQKWLNDRSAKLEATENTTDDSIEAVQSDEETSQEFGWGFNPMPFDEIDDTNDFTPLPFDPV